MKIGVVIATHNRVKHLAKLGSCIMAQQLPPGVECSVVVVVDGSTDGTIEMLGKDFPAFHVVKGDGNLWWTRAMNRGFKAAQALGRDHVLVLNDDNEIKPDYISTLLMDYRSLPAGSILGSASLSLEEPVRISFAGTSAISYWRMKYRPYLKDLSLLPESFSGIKPTCTLSGRGMFFPTSVFDRIGFFDQNLPQYGSDDEFALRARKNGVNVFVSWNARVYTHLGMTSAGSVYRNDSLAVFIKSFFNPYSVNSVRKAAYFYARHGVRVLTPFYVLYFILATFRAKYLK